MNKDFYEDLPGYVCLVLDCIIEQYGNEEWFDKAWEEYRQHIKNTDMDHQMMPGWVFNKYAKRPQTIYKFKEVLDAKEKEYLSNLIEPFKKRVIRIEKIKTLYGNSEFINIVLYSSISCNKEESIQLPYFKKGKMYKGMKRDKKYTLKELGLD